MSRQSSIPRDLEPVIVRRWVKGQSPQAILQWLNESNAGRKEPVTTSVSSVLRCIERAAARESDAACLASVHRARMRSSALMDQLAVVDDGYREVTADSRTASEHQCRKLGVRLASLGKLELSTHRQLKLAGVGGAFGDKLAETNRALAREMSRDMAAEDDLIDAGLPPEITPRHLPPELFPPAPLTPEIMSALQRHATTAWVGHRASSPAASTTPPPAPGNLSESNPLVSQPIVHSIRRDPTPPAPVRLSELERQLAETIGRTLHVTTPRPTPPTGVPTASGQPERVEWPAHEASDASTVLTSHQAPDGDRGRG